MKDEVGCWRREGRSAHSQANALQPYLRRRARPSFSFRHYSRPDPDTYQKRFVIPYRNNEPKLIKVQVHSPNACAGSWSPFTFRWYFLLLPASLSLVFCIALFALVFYSRDHQGIGPDNGSSAILFGWRFTPTLFAVLYAQLTVILFEDAKRTEPFARLARAPVGGSPALGTVLQTPRAWWSVFFDIVFKRKAMGKTSWCLICCAMVNVLALLAISPLSSALLSSTEMTVARSTDFSRMVPKAGVQLPVDANRETYFRALSALMRTVSTSAWVTDTSLTMPIWPGSGPAQLGPNLVSNYSTWTAETTTLYADLNCQKMILQSATLAPKQFLAYSAGSDGPTKKLVNGTQEMVTFVLTSPGGCRYELSNHPARDFAYNGGLRWVNTSTYPLPTSEGSITIEGQFFVPNVTSTHPFARAFASRECRDRDILLLGTPWTNPVPEAQATTTMLGMNKTAGTAYWLLNQTTKPIYEQSSNFQMKGFLCESQYAMKTQNVTISMTFGKQPVFKQSPEANTSKVPVTNTHVDIAGFQEMAMRNDWMNYFNSDSVNSDASNNPNQARKPTTYTKQVSLPEFTGLGPILGALYSFNISAMMDDEHFMKQAARVKGRLFTEFLRESLNNANLVETKPLKGETTTTEQRVIVLPGIGLALAVLCLVSFFLLLFIFAFSRPARRPLHLQTDPGSTIGQGVLLPSQSESRYILRSLHNTTSSDFHDALTKHTFSNTKGTLATRNNELQSEKRKFSSATVVLVVQRLTKYISGACRLNTCQASEAAALYSHSNATGLNFSTTCCAYWHSNNGWILKPLVHLSTRFDICSRLIETSY